MATKKKQQEKVWATYGDYLQSDEWKHIRQLVHDRDNSKCRICGKSATETHHHRYPKNLADDSPDNCIAICEDCHTNVHGNGPPVEITPYRMFNRYICVSWEHGYGCVIRGLPMGGPCEINDIVVGDHEIRWLIDKLETVDTYYGDPHGE